MDDAVRKAGYYSDSQKYDFTEMLSLLRSEMTGDITFLTLENLIQPEVKVSALNAPDAAAELLRTTGVNLVAIGFPKVYDKGADGVRTTLEALHDRNLLTIGAYNTQGESKRHLHPDAGQRARRVPALHRSTEQHGQESDEVLRGILRCPAGECGNDFC